MTVDRLSLTLSALANPTRRAILARLTRGEATVNELAAPFSLTLPAISKHLKVLERVGLVTKRKHAQQRPCALESAQLRDVARWLAPFQAQWGERMDRLGVYLADLPADRPATVERGRERPARRGR
ncbi:MAG TPA: metalloregulator ArsR/SmtB family transcription factor [Thermoplasmata archaeon]|nr:metalloregulator ArsR/SmtB family transcription factor [Thermoplasmata archaeon]